MYAIPADSDVVMKESDSIKKAESKNTEDQQQQQEEDFDGIISFTLETKKKDKIDAAIAQSQHQQDTSDGYESSDLSSSDDDDDDDDNNNDHVQNGDVEDIEDDLDDEGNKEPTEPLRTKHELVHIIIDTVNFEITPATKLTPIGTIEEIIDNVIVVHSHPDMANTVLDMGTLFAFEDRTTMGEVFETFGPVSRPYYSVRFNSPDEIDKGKATVGAQVSYVPMYERTKLVPVEELRKKTYTDASNAYDEEISDEDIDFSDDEKELAHKQSKKKKKNRTKPAAPGNRVPIRQKPALIPDDFDAALAAYEQTATPGRELQNYADISEGSDGSPIVPQQFRRPLGVPLPQFATADPPWYMGQSSITDVQQQRRKNKGKGRGKPQNDIDSSHQSWKSQGQQQQKILQQPNYQSPDDLVSSLLESYGGNIPNLSASGQPSTSNSTQNTNANHSVRSLFSIPPPSSSKGA